MFSVTGSTAVVTGAGSGIGLATGLKLIEQGANLVVNGRKMSDGIERLQSAAEVAGVKSLFVAGDVRNADTAVEIAARAKEDFGRVDILVHSAGGPAAGNLATMPFKDWLDAFDVHVHSVFHLFQALHPALAVRGGAVVLLSSVAGLRGCPGNTAYQMTKGALPQMARALARDHSAEGIRINCVAPGIIRTPFHSGMTEDARLNNIKNRIPMGREGTPEQVAAMIAQLIENEFITGETVVIDGGMSMRMV